MKSGKIYIIPTGFGLIFLSSVVIILFAGAIYTNNLVNLLAFFLLAVALVAMVQTHNNLKNIALKLVETEPGFADDAVQMTAALENFSQAPRFMLEVRLQKSFPFLGETGNIAAPLRPRALLKQKTAYAVRKRGRHELKRVCISTIYPVGLFHAWMWLPTDAHFLVYPARKGNATLPQTTMLGEEGSSYIASRGGEDFRGHRSFVPGDSSNRIDWKAFARGRSLLIKEFDQGNPEALLFDWDRTPGADHEAKLSQLTLWVERAFLQKRRYALQLPTQLISPNEGLQHYERCLEALALYPGEQNATAAG